MGTPVAPLTRKSFIQMSTEDLKKLVNDPEKLAEANAILDGSVVPEVVPDAPITPTPDEAAIAQAEVDRIATETATSAKIEADKLAAKELENESYKSAGIVVETDSNGSIVKIVKTYQARDDAGNPIGRPTYLEAKSWPELSVKQQTAHENAVRFAERIKKQKATIKKDDPAPVQVLSETELLKLQEDLKGEDRDKAAEAAEKVRQNDERKKLIDADQAIEEAKAAKESYKFLSKHVYDYNNCEANNKLLSDYIKDNNLEWIEENLEVALTAVESQLAPKEQPAPPVPANPAPVVPAAVPPQAPAAPPAPPVAPNPPVPPAQAALPASRPGVNGGLVPGEQSAVRPTNQPKGLTKADIKAMSREEYKRRLKDPKFVSEVNALLARK